MAFEIEVTDVGVRCSGEVDLATAPNLLAGMVEALQYGPGRIVADLSDVTFFDSMGVSALLVANRDADGRLVVRASPTVWHVLEVSGLLQDGNRLDVEAPPAD